MIAGEIGSGALGYTAVGEQVGMAQRMESVAPPGGVMLSASTARLVEHAAVLAEPEMVRIKGADAPVPARRLLGVATQRRHGRWQSTLVGRRWEMDAIAGMLGHAIDGTGRVVGWWAAGHRQEPHRPRDRRCGQRSWRRRCSPRTASRMPATSRSTWWRGCCAPRWGSANSTKWLPGRGCAASADADSEDLLCSMICSASPILRWRCREIDPDARRRRLTALVNAASLARSTPAVYVIEDVHWIDEVSESMLADFAVGDSPVALDGAGHLPSRVPGVLTHRHGAQTIALRPLEDSQTSALAAELLGADPSVGGLAEKIAERAAGNPFFAEEIVRDLAERGVLGGERGAYMCDERVAEVSVPATLQAAIAARIDRLDPSGQAHVVRCGGDRIPVQPVSC